MKQVEQIAEDFEAIYHRQVDPNLLVDFMKYWADRNKFEGKTIMSKEEAKQFEEAREFKGGMVAWMLRHHLQDIFEVDFKMVDRDEPSKYYPKELQATIKIKIK